MNMTTKTYCVFGLTLVWALSGGCADTHAGKLRPGQGTKVIHPDLRDLQTWKLLPKKVQKLRDQYVAALRSQLKQSPYVAARFGAAILLAREGNPEGVTYLVKGSLAARTLEGFVWEAGIEKTFLDNNMLKELYNSRDAASRRGAVYMMLFAPSPKEHPQALRTMIKDPKEDMGNRSFALYALAANDSWEDVPFIAEIAVSEKAPKELSEGAKESLARFVGKEYGEKMKVEEFGAYLMEIARQLPREKSASKKRK